MDLDEWELLPVDGFLDYSDDDYEKKMKKKKPSLGKIRAAGDSTTVFNVDLDYFRCPSPPTQLVPVRIHLDPPVKKDPGGETEEGTEKNRAPPAMADAADTDTVSQVFFKKIKENEFVDMKILESPRSGSRPISPPIENFRFEDRPENLDCPRSPARSPDMVGDEVNSRGGGGLNIWKWSLAGIGALCSFGLAAAATIGTIVIIGTHQRNKNQQKIRFQFCTDDKRIKQVVHHATKLNEAISAARGVPLSRAHITFGGYYEGL